MSAPFTIRPADANDDEAIHDMIHAVGINPTGLDWRRFIVAVSPEKEIIACGQVKPHRDGSRELASIAVAPEWRGQGAARAIIERLIAEHPGPLYLTCRARLGSFYERFGFRPAHSQELPAYFRRLHLLVRVVQKLGVIPGELLIMTNKHDLQS